MSRNPSINVSADSATATAPSEGALTHDTLVTGQRVLRLEARSISRLSDELDASFVSTIELLARVRGRIVVSGMGKSGHIANKIAATLASTGAPAMFVHPAEASHGDLGMITNADALIVLSNSGETSELSDMVHYAKRFEIPLVAIVGRPKSTLGNAASVALVLPETPEACPLGLAPTTSTTMMVALGDALAVALLERKGFTEEDFQRFHPGGKLGQRLIRVGDIMHDGDAVPLVDSGTAMSEALIVMTAKSFGCVGVTDAKGRLVGVVTDGDLRRHMKTDLLDRTVKEVMTGSPLSIRPSALAAEAVRIMNERKITSLFVVAGDQPRGILHVHDCLRAGLV
jgi:arabinose-5-phosphate isomerase